MSEKRFVFVCDDENCRFKDNGETIDCVEVVDLLNEQQSEINSLKLELELISGEKLFSRRELERKVDEQQATITELKEENEKLRQENNFLKQIREAFQIDVKNSRQKM